MLQVFSSLPAEVQAAYISSASTLLATLLAGITAMIVGKQIIKQKKAAERLHVAMSDIEFLLAVEKEHCEFHRNESEKSLKNTMRDRARDLGFQWSGKYSQSKIVTMREKLPSLDYLREPE